jgi:hypothetical protein
MASDWNAVWAKHSMSFIASRRVPRINYVASESVDDVSSPAPGEGEDAQQSQTSTQWTHLTSLGPNELVIEFQFFSISLISA